LLSAYQVSSLSCYIGIGTDAKKTTCPAGDRCFSITTGETATVYSCSDKTAADLIKADDTCSTLQTVKTCVCKTDDCNDPNAKTTTTAKPADSAATTQSTMQIFSMIAILSMVYRALA